MPDGPHGRFIRTYLDRIVNHRDLSGVDELVSRDYVGSGDGWPATFDALRRFYASQAVQRPDWRIDVRETVELADTVVVRAAAGGVVVGPTSQRTEVEWLARYRVRGGLIREIDVLALVEVERHVVRPWTGVRRRSSP